MTGKLGYGDTTMSLAGDVRPLLAARAATDTDAARLLEMFTKAEETLSEFSPERIGARNTQAMTKVPKFRNQGHRTA